MLQYWKIKVEQRKWYAKKVQKRDRGRKCKSWLDLKQGPSWEYGLNLIDAF